MFRVIKDILVMVGVGLILVAGLVTVFWGATLFTPEYKVYNCALAEISPDYPIRVKEECRNLRSGRI